MNENARLGMVVAGSLSEGVAVRLDSKASVEDVVVGRYVTIQGKSRRFLGMITDVKLDSSDQRMTFSPPDPADTFSAEVLSGTSAYGTLTVTPYPHTGRGCQGNSRRPAAGQDHSESFLACKSFIGFRY